MQCVVERESSANGAPLSLIRSQFWIVNHRCSKSINTNSTNYLHFLFQTLQFITHLNPYSRKWQREHKNAMGSPVFGYMGGGQVKTPVMGQAPYQVTLEDRMRWAQIADVMAQANHYAVSGL